MRLHSLKTVIAELTPRSIRITCAPNNNVLEGTLFTACNTTNAIAINTAPAPPNPSASLSSQPGDYHIIPFAHILSFEIVGLGERATEPNVGFDGAIPSIAKVDMAALRAREEQTIREMKKKDAQKGKGVSNLAQELYDTLAKLYVPQQKVVTWIQSLTRRTQAPYKMGRGPDCRQRCGAYTATVHPREHQSTRW